MRSKDLGHVELLQITRLTEAYSGCLGVLLAMKAHSRNNSLEKYSSGP
jgi:hypothetical protein